MSLYHRIFRGAAMGLLLVMVTILVTIAHLKLIVYFLPDAISGAWLLFITLGTFIAYFDLGVSPTIGREISFVLGEPKLSAEEKDLAIADHYRTCRRIFSVLSVAVLCLGATAGYFFLAGVVDEDVSRPILQAWLFFSAGAVLQLWNGANLSILYGLGYIATERFIRIFGHLLSLGLIAFNLYHGFGILGLAIGWIAQHAIVFLVSLRTVYTRFPAIKAQGSPKMAIARNIVAPSLKWAATSLGAVLVLQTDNIVISTMRGTTEIPTYEAAAKIATMLITVSMMIVSASMPFMSKLYAEKKDEQFKILLLRNVRYATTLVAMLAGFMAVFGDVAIRLWLGEDKFVGYPVLWTVMTMALLEVHHVALATGTMSTGRILFAVPAILAGVLNLIISFVLVGILGLWGVALGTLTAQLLTNNWYAPYITLKLFKIKFSSYFFTTLFPMALCAGIFVLVSMGTRRMMGDELDLIGLIFSFMIFVMASALLSFPIIFTQADRAALTRKIKYLYRA